MANKKPVNNQKASRGKNRRAGNVELSAEDKRTRLAKELRLKPKSKQVLDEIINNKGITQTDAYIKYHPNSSRAAAAVRASNLVNSDKGRIYTSAAVGKAKRRVVSLVDSSNESIALKASQDILDRTEGKAVQKSETLNRTVEVKLDLTGLRVGSHNMKPTITAPEAEIVESHNM